MGDDWYTGDSYKGAAAVGWDGSFELRVWNDEDYATRTLDEEEATLLRDAIDRWLNEGGAR